MQQQVLPPGVENADHADFCSQVFGISRDLQQSLRAGSEQQVVEQTRVFQGQHIEFVRHGEDHVKVAGGEDLSFPCRDPVLAGFRLALGAMTVSAGVIRDGFVSALQTGIDVSAQRCRAAALARREASFDGQ